MNIGQLVSVLWKRRVLFLVAVVLFTGAVVLATVTLPPTYRSTATLLVGNTDKVNEALAFDTAVGERLTRTYTTLAGNPNVATQVAATLPFAMTRGELLSRMSFAPVERTQLLEISAQDSSPARTRFLANRYAEVFVDRVNAQFARGDAPTTISLSEASALPLVAVRPNPPLYLGLGFPLALLLAAGVVLLRERLDDRIGTGQTGDLLGEPVVARLPLLSGRGATTRAEVADILRLLRATLDLTPEGRPQVLAFTSGGQGEGKSTICAHFALTAAADGERVAVVEADMRRPGLGATVLGENIAKPATGLSRYLVGTDGADAALFSHPAVSGLDVIWAGPAPPNPAALLASDRMGELIELLSERYDRILIDTPPILVGADATLALHHADATLFVVDARSTRRSEATRGLTQLRATGVTLAGVLVNRAKRPRTSAYGYYAAGPSAPPTSSGRSRAGV